MALARTRRILAVMGTRPEAIKLAPLCLDVHVDDDLEVLVVATGQHREMLDQVLEHFGLEAVVDLDVHEPRQRLEDLTARVLVRMAPVLAELHPDAVAVQGDTTSALAAALAAFYASIPVVHVEAGLRSGDVTAPFPEEMNRRLISQLATIHLAPTPAARDNLLVEGVPEADVFVTGNTVIDALLRTRATASLPPELSRLAQHDGQVLVVTAHRRESWGAPLEAVGRAIRRLALDRPELLVVLPMHLNPAVREALGPALEGLTNVLITGPLDYPSFVACLSRATVLLTDSGGIQEEGPALGIPVLVMRETTERPEGVRAGTALLVGTDEEVIVSEVGALLDDEAHHQSMARAVNPYGDGRAAVRSIAAVRRMLGDQIVVDQFDPSEG